MSDSILMGNLVTEAEVIQVPEVQFILIRPAVFRPCLTTGLASITSFFDMQQGSCQKY